MTETTDRGPGVLETLRLAPASVKAVLFGLLINKLGAFLQVFLVLFLTTRGFTGLQAGMALGAYGAGSVLGVLLGGALADRIGARLTILASMAGSAALLVAVLYVTSYPVMLATVVSVGAVSQLYRPAAATLLAELTPENRQVMIFAVYRLAMNVGATLGPIVGATLAAVSYDFLFWAEALTSLGYAAIVVLFLPRRRPATAEDADDAMGSTEDTADGADTTGASDPGTERAGSYLDVLRDRRYAAYLVAVLLNSMIYVQYLSTLPLAMTDAGLSTLAYGAMVSINGFIVICFELLATKWVQNWPARIAFAVGFTLLGTGLACYALPGGLAVFAIGTLIWSLAEIIAGPTLMAYPAKAGPERLRGRYLGFSQAMFGLGTAAGPMIGVALWTTVGSATWVIIGATSLFAIIPAWYGTTKPTPCPQVPRIGAGADTAERRCRETDAA